MLHTKFLCIWIIGSYEEKSPVCCHLFVVAGLSISLIPIAMLAGVFIHLLGPPKSDRLKD